MTFHGKIRAEQSVFNRVHESPFVMTMPVLLLGGGSLFAGLIFKNYFVGSSNDVFWLEAIFTNATNTVLHDIHHVPIWVPWAPSVMMLIGLILAFYGYLVNTRWIENVSMMHKSVYNFLCHKWYFDEIYSLFIVRPFTCLGYFLWKKGDQGFIDKFGPDGLAVLSTRMTSVFVRLQTGFIYHYAFAMVVGLTFLLSLVVLGAF